MKKAPPVSTPAVPPSLEKLSRLMDSSIRLPGGYRIGWDGIIGLVPGIGDAVGLGISLYILFGAQRAGASSATLARMAANVGIETLLGSVPVLGDLFDFVFKANNRNMRLLQNQIAMPEKTDKRSKRSLYLVALVLLVVVILLIALFVRVISALFGLIF